MTREPSFEELIGAETTGDERERLRRAHELLLQAGPPAELPPGLQKAPQMGLVNLQERRRVMKRRTLLLLAAALSAVAVFFAGYAVSNQRSSSPGPPVAKVVSLKGTARAPGAKGELEVWHPSAGNWPMKLRVSGLAKLPPRFYYAVYWVRDGRILAPCGQFRVDGPQALTVSLNAPYPLQPGDSWVVTRQGPGGAEPGTLVMRPVTA